MINGEKIGVGIVTCNRKDMFNKLFESLLPCRDIIDRLCVVQDITKYYENYEERYKDQYIGGAVYGGWKDEGYSSIIHYPGENIGVARAKNICMKNLMDCGCDHIFLIEDDMLIKDPTIFEKYIKASKVSGIQHLMFGYHGPANKNGVSGGKPCPRLVINYSDDVSIALNQHCVGAFCYYSRKSLETCGLIDEGFKNAFDHVSHSYTLYLHGFSTPYWWWSDVANSYDFIVEQACSENSSTIKTPERMEEWRTNFFKSMDHFKEKFGKFPFGNDGVLDTDEEAVKKFIKITIPK